MQHSFMLNQALSSQQAAINAAHLRERSPWHEKAVPWGGLISGWADAYCTVAR
jgi:hypothetical protein